MVRFAATMGAVVLVDGAAHLALIGRDAWVFAPVWIAVGLAAAIVQRRSASRSPT